MLYLKSIPKSGEDRNNFNITSKRNHIIISTLYNRVLIEKKVPNPLMCSSFSTKCDWFYRLFFSPKNAVWITNMQVYLPTTICQRITHFNRIFISMYSGIYKSSTTLGNTALNFWYLLSYFASFEYIMPNFHY